jgi:hypothetical protein
VNQIGTEEREVGLIWDMVRAKERIGGINRKSAAMATLFQGKSLFRRGLAARFDQLPVAK